MNSILIAIFAAGLIWSAAAAVYVFMLRKRMLARFEQGFLYSLLIAMVGGALMASTVIGIWGYESAKRLLEQEVVDQLADIGAIIDAELTNQLENVSRQLNGFGTTLLPFLDRKETAAALGVRLQAALSINERLLELHLFDEQGRLIASSSRIETTEPVSRQAIGANLDGKPFVSDADRSKAFNRQVLFISEPLRDPSGLVRGAIGTRFDLQSELADLVGSLKFNASGYAAMVDGDGQVVAHHDTARLERDVSSYPAVRRARETRTVGSVVALNDRGDEKLFVYRPIDNPGTVERQPWVLLTEIDAAELVAPVRKLRKELAAAIGLLLIVSIVMAHQVTRSVNQPLHALGEFAHKIGSGDLTSRVPIEGRDIAGRLAATLNEMAAGLQERDHVKEVFGRYIATQVSDEILKGQVDLGGAEKTVTVLFSDIRNFTGMSEQMTPQQVVSFLNDYFTEMVDAVFEHGGVLDKFLGDGLMAVFGSISDDPNHPRNAVLAALRMQALLAKINGVRAMSAKPPIAIGVGIHTDSVIVGNIGSRKRLEYTVVGDGVNTSSRLQALNKEFGTTILISETTHQAVSGEFECRQMPDTQLRGKTKDLKIYEVVSMKALAAV
ncbi:MAG TPA: adenylate/guanylate cyclase domain-containing protein [Vicinamibacterales bacterium]|nr:adenylate/guanylate cyclase domain-containing protein [Vicinamibacterales bacterium]